MTSYLWGSSSAASFDALLDKSTSDTLPSGSSPDLSASLNLADLIRSTSITPQVAVKSLLRRLAHSNPNVQLLALSIFDICVKNGGTPFLLQVGSSSCVKELESQAKNGTNREVRLKVLSKIQDWATAFREIPALRDTELVHSYSILKNAGFTFPARDASATAAFVDSLSAPEWTDSPYCTRCRNPFTTFNRKHHCRNCGQVFDQACSASTAPLPHYGVMTPVRVCDGCVRKIKEGTAAKGLSRSVSLGSPSDRGYEGGRVERSSTVSGSSRKSSHRSSNSTSAISRNNEDDDLQKAIAASLRDVNHSSPSGPAFELRKNSTPVPYSNSGYNAAYSQSIDNAPSKGESEDPDLAAAIAASLRDVASAASAPQQTYASLYPTQSYAPPPTFSSPVNHPTLQTYDLSPTETSSLEAFTSHLAGLPPSNSRMGERERDLYDRASRVMPRLERGMEDTERRKEILVEMNGKLAEAASLYERMLDERVRGGANGRISYPQQPSNYPASPLQQQSYAPPQQSYYSSPPPMPYQYLANNYPAQTSQPLAPQSYAPQYAQPNTEPPQSGVEQQSQEQQQQQQQQQHQQQAPPQQQPAGIYYPSSFPAVPTTNPIAFPSVPTANPWEDNPNRESRQASVGELIEL